MMADVDDEDKALEEIKTKIDVTPEYSENRYYNPATDGPLDGEESPDDSGEPQAKSPAKAEPESA